MGKQRRLKKLSSVDAQVVELIGRNRLGSELLREGLEVAVPARDRGVDLIAYADLSSRVQSFIARPIQMKAASRSSFSLHRKYRRLADLIIAYVWYINDPSKTVTYALTYKEAYAVAKRMKWTKTDSWKMKHAYSTTRPGSRLRELLEPYRMREGKWWEKVTGAKHAAKGRRKE
jgi:hypothetical protein